MTNRAPGFRDPQRLAGAAPRAPRPTTPVYHGPIRERDVTGAPGRVDNMRADSGDVRRPDRGAAFRPTAPKLTRAERRAERSRRRRIAYVNRHQAAQNRARREA